MSTANYARLPPSNVALLRHQSRHSGDFVKQSRSGGVSLRLIDQGDDTRLPVYGHGSSVEGMVNLAKPAGIARVEVKIDGRLILKEIAEGGATTSNIGLDTAVLWERDSADSQCPSSFSFCLVLPTTFLIEDTIYPLPPTYEAHLSGLPGFKADISYSVSTIVTRVKSSLLGVLDGRTTVSTPFIYYPRSRPTVPLPMPLATSHHGVLPTSEWLLFPATIDIKDKGRPNIISQLYLPSSRTYCVSQPIPFYLVFRSSAISLAAFMPYGPMIGGLPKTKRPMRLQLLRQSTVDVSNHTQPSQRRLKTDIWTVDTIGEASFERMGDGPDWIAFSGIIVINDQVKVAGFKVGGFHVKDCLVLSMIPLDPTKSPFNQFRQVIPVHLTTDAWMPNGTCYGFREYSLSSTGADDQSVLPGYAQ